MNKYTLYIKKAILEIGALLLIITASLSSCKKAIDIGAPETLVNTANVYSSDQAAEAVISGLYSNMAAVSKMYNGVASMTIQQGLAADEFKYYGTINTAAPSQFYTNNLSSSFSYYWPEIYSELFTCNSAIEGLNSDAAGALTPSVKQPLLGEAKFTRAFIYFNAVNLYGDVPLVLNTDPNANATLSRTPAADVMQQVIKDLTEAQVLLPDNSYVTLSGLPSTTTNRILPNKQAASALLARAYLYLKDWKNAELQASNVISASSYLLEPVLTNVFLKASRETIWQLQSVSATYGNGDASTLIMIAAPSATANNYALSNSLVSAFETGDNRFNSWVGKLQSGTTTYYYAAKYKQAQASSASLITEYPVMLRLAEQYLIRAEARAQQNNISGAQSDLNAIRARAGLTNTTASTQIDLLTAIYHERQIELFVELGHRWFDLKRTGLIDAVMSVASPLKGGSWSSFKALLPLPLTDLQADYKLTQNPGYN